VTLNLDFKVSVTIDLDALDVLCVQLTCNLFAIAKFLFNLNSCFLTETSLLRQFKH